MTRSLFTNRSVRLLSVCAISSELAEVDGVDRAFREDRELVYVVAPRLTSDRLTDAIARAWSFTA